MPCSDGGWPARAESYERQSSETQARLDNVTRLLCELCTHLEDAKRSDLFASVAGLKGWWEAHKRRDAERREIERQVEEAAAAELRKIELGKQALNKLTNEEREALGF